MTYRCESHHIIDEDGNTPARYGNFDRNFFRTEAEALAALPRFEQDRATLGHHSQVIGLPIWALQQIANDLRNDDDLRAEATTLYELHTGRDVKYLPRVAYKGYVPVFTEEHMIKIGEYFVHPDVKADIADDLRGDFSDAESNGYIIAHHFKVGFEGERNASNFFSPDDWGDEEEITHRFITAETPEEVIEALQELIETL
ncbi:hypothetical protein [Corynebacterium ulcerans]|uniref:hypothetical protein n=1 Tax=Corynebacterium ulcerans TaxID=65058 RepID=UPI0002141BAF|nr:hypothetical protein [Corynebacterium ulcerans]AEG84376.1 hypothetical protein CULC22_01666 [Corynebacterium ulcerans BR-AD22]